MKTVAVNRRARFDYQILETLEAGIVLSGQEAKSCRMGHVNLAGAYVSFLGGKARIKHLKISAYPFASGLDAYDPEQDRELLLKKTELIRLQGMADQKGVTVVPLEVKAGRYIKLVLGVGEGRKRVDKRRAIRDREVDRQLREGREV